MVRINKKYLVQKSFNEPSIHDLVNKAEYDIFTGSDNGKNVSVIQINTYGFPTRKNPNKASQTIQFEVDAVKDLYSKIVEYGRNLKTSINKSK